MVIRMDRSLGGQSTKTVTKPVILQGPNPAGQPSKLHPFSMFMKEMLSAGTGSADIDNKIEQAMDLVKSHLMYAVREEVDDLKQEIVALRDRNSRLEYENSVLKSYAPQDVLSQLSNTSTPPAPVQAPTNNSSSSGGNVALTGQATAQESTAPQQQQ